MGGPSWLADALAVVMITTAAYCASRVAAAWRWRRPTQYDVDGAHAFMGVAMAGMLIPSLNPFGDGGWWEVVFGVAAAWFGARAVAGYLRGRPGRLSGRRPAAGQPAPGQQAPEWSRDARHTVGHHLRHLLGCGAMLYMLVVISAGRGGAAGMPVTSMPMTGTTGGAAGFPTVALGLALALFAGVLWTLDRLTSPGPTGAVRADAGAVGKRADPTGAGAARAAGSVAVEASARPTAAGVTSYPMAAGVTGYPTAAGVAGYAAAACIRAPLSPRLAAGCEIAMGLTMGYMLITML